MTLGQVVGILLAVAVGLALSWLVVSVLNVRRKFGLFVLACVIGGFISALAYVWPF